MQSDWLAATNFERMHEVVSALNTLAIHAKLTLADVVDPTPGPEIESAQKRLLTFLDQLGDAVEEAKATAGGPVVGSDPRLTDLTQRLLASGSHSDAGPRLAIASPERLRDLVSGNGEANRREMVTQLERLRTLIEEHMQADVADILGDESW